MMNPNITADLQIRKLPFRTLRQLADLLDIPGSHDWKALISELPDGEYDTVEIAQLERDGYRPGGSSALALLTDFGHQLRTVGELIVYLEAINHQEALLLIKPHQPVFITSHPLSVITQAKQDIRLSCRATGFPRPRYQWYRYETAIPGKCAEELVLKNVTEENSGDYYCKVTNPIGSEYSDVANIQVTPLWAEIRNGVTAPEGTMKSIEIMNNVGFNEETVVLYPGQYFVLNCDTTADAYQWHKNGYSIPNASGASLVFSPFQLADEGHYSCKIYANGQYIVTRLAHLKLSDMIIPRNLRNDDLSIPNPKLLTNKEFATGKLALVIANQNYYFPRSDSENLVHPIDDAKLLAETLENVGFKVTCLVNLTKKEMEAAINGFCNLLQCAQGVYSLFYFCGHGFEEHGKTYLVPVDASSDWMSSNALSAEHILSDIQHCKTTKLDVLLLDVCRIPSGNDEIFNDFKRFDPPFIPGAQCVFGYATCPQSQAFEKRGDTNGIYMKHLAHHISENIQIETLLHKVGVAVREEAERHHITNSMAPTFKSTTTKTFSLRDNILPGTGFIEGERDPVVEWFAYHRLPANQSIYFDHDIIVEMRFLPVCSNICSVLIHVSSMGKANYCDAKIIEVCEDLEVPGHSMNQEMSILPEVLSKSLRFDSPNSVQSSERPSETVRLTQVSGLQKLSGPFALTIEMEYSLGEELQYNFKKQIFRNDEFGIVSFFNT